MLPAIYVLGCFAFAVVNFESYVTARPQFLRYVAAPALIFAVFAVTALYGSRNSRVLLGGTGIAVLVAMFAFEARLEWRYATVVQELTDVPSAQWMAARNLTRGLPPSRTPQAVNDQLEITDVSKAMLSGVPGEPVLLCRRADEPVVYRADRFGFRNPEALYGTPVQRLLLGDSFVEGICLPEPMDLVGRMRALQPATVGLGIRGAGPLSELAMLGRFGPAIRPKWVVMVFYEGNDWENLEQEVRYPWLHDALSPDADFGPVRMPQDLRSHASSLSARWIANGPVDASTERRRTDLVRNTLALHQTWSQLGLGYPKAAPTMPVYGQVLARIKAVTASWGGRVAVMYVPQTGRLIGVFPDGFVYDRIRWQVAEAAGDNSIPLVDLSAAFDADPDSRTLYGSDGHFSERGAALAARTLDDVLRTQEAQPR